jgi:hypothetical protein
MGSVPADQYDFVRPPAADRSARGSYRPATDYGVNRKRSLEVVERRVRKHLTPFFEGHTMANITTPLINQNRSR